MTTSIRAYPSPGTDQEEAARWLIDKADGAKVYGSGEGTNRVLAFEVHSSSAKFVIEELKELGLKVEEAA